MIKRAARCSADVWNSLRSGMFLHSSAVEGEERRAVDVVSGGRDEERD